MIVLTLYLDNYSTRVEMKKEYWSIYAKNELYNNRIDLFLILEEQREIQINNNIVRNVFTSIRKKYLHLGKSMN